MEHFAACKLLYKAVAMVAPGFEIWEDRLRFLDLGPESSNDHAIARGLLLYALWQVHNMLRRQRTPMCFIMTMLLPNTFGPSCEKSLSRPTMQTDADTFSGLLLGPPLPPPPVAAVDDVGDDERPGGVNGGP